MAKLVIFGRSDFAHILFSLIEEQGVHEVVAFTVNESYIDGDRFLDRPLVSFETIEEQFPPNEHRAMVAVGYSKMNKVRKEKYLDFKGKGYTMESFLATGLRIPSSASLGDHCLLLDQSYIHPMARIGNNVVSWSGNVVGHHSKIGDHSFISSLVCVSGYAELGEGAFLGPCSMVESGIKIGKRVFVGPNASVRTDLADESVVTAPDSKLRSIKSSRLPRF